METLRVKDQGSGSRTRIKDQDPFPFLLLQLHLPPPSYATSPTHGSNDNAPLHFRETFPYSHGVAKNILQMSLLQNDLKLLSFFGWRPVKRVESSRDYSMNHLDPAQVITWGNNHPHASIQNHSYLL